MLLVDDIRKKLLTQRRDLFRQVVQTEEELLWFQNDVESEVEERGQEESMVRLLDRLDGRAKVEIKAIGQALVRIESSQYGRCATCGEDIPPSRLEVSPAVTMCVACEQAAETQAALAQREGTLMTNPRLDLSLALVESGGAGVMTTGGEDA